MFGNEYRCNKCEFEFCSGWSHHSGGQHLVCVNCTTEFILGDGKSNWGPIESEILKLFECSENGPVPTDKSFMVKLKNRVKNKFNGIINLDISGLGCPKCNSPEVLIQEFQVNQFCPSCKEGVVIKSGTCIY